MDSKKLGIGLVALAVVAFATFTLVSNQNSIPNSQTATITNDTDPITGNSDAGTTTNTNTTSNTSNSADVSEATSYKDGEYTAVGTYTAPPGEEEIGVTVTLEDGIIIATNIEKLGKHEVSQKMQASFEGAYRDEVIGKNIDEVELDVVGVSSLTPAGFEDALEQIREQASQA